MRSRDYPDRVVEKKRGESFLFGKGTRPVRVRNEGGLRLFDAEEDAGEGDLSLDEGAGEGGDVVGVVFVCGFEDGVSAKVAENVHRQ